MQGWQVGWMVAPERFIAPVQTLLPCIQFCAATPIQQALANAIRIADLPYMGQTRYFDTVHTLSVYASPKFYLYFLMVFQLLRVAAYSILT